MLSALESGSDTTLVPVARRTIASPASFAGFALFTGKETAITIRPSPPGAGIVFRRADLPGSAAIPASAVHVIPEARRTVLSARPGDPLAPTVQTVEHVMSALAGLGIADALIEVTGPEIPIADGSARPFVDAIVRAGISSPTSAGAEPPVVIETPIVIGDAAARVEAHPPTADRPGLELTYRLEYPPGAPIQPQEASLFVPLGERVSGYIDDVAPARTFCLAQEAEMMRKAGMFSHLGPRDMMVIGPNGPIENTYRFSNEPARHKLLDLLGDLALCGRPVIGRVIATRTGHAHNHAMARAMAAL
jgi:UDP-3-O-acyl N-acetylglucosamine deacetylase